MLDRETGYFGSPLTRRGLLLKLASVLPAFWLKNNSIYLTFDDGYSGLSDKIDVLNNLKVPATFFLTGGAIRQHPEQVRLLVASGHSLKNHTYGHPYLTRLSKAGILSELERCEQAAQEIAGVSTKPYMRPPYGAVNASVRQTAEEAGYETVMWTQDTRDWVGTQPLYIAQRIKPGIVLMHTQGRNTVKALYEAIPSLLEDGYRFAIFENEISNTPQKTI